MNKLTKDTRMKYILDYIFTVEGGYVYHKDDPGGETIYGITKSTAVSNGYMGNLKDMPKEVAVNIYINEYWNKYNLDMLSNFAVALCIFDLIVHSGRANAIKVAQKSVNFIVDANNKLGIKSNVKKLTIDGHIGTNTINSINKIDPMIFITTYVTFQEELYEKLQSNNSNLNTFETGWDSRIITKIIMLNNILKEVCNEG